MGKQSTALDAAIDRVNKRKDMFSEGIRNDLDLIMQAAKQAVEIPDREAIRAEVMDEVVELIGSLKKKDVLIAKRRPPKKGPKRRTIDDIDIPEAEKDEIRLRLLEARLVSEEEVERVTRDIIKSLGLQNCLSRNRIMGGMLAHTQGKHRAQFIRRVMGRATDEQRPELIERLMRLCDMSRDAISSAANIH